MSRIALAFSNSPKKISRHHQDHPGSSISGPMVRTVSCICTHFCGAASGRARRVNTRTSRQSRAFQHPLDPTLMIFRDNIVYAEAGHCSGG
jgi:hypothetical protein